MNNDGILMFKNNSQSWGNPAQQWIKCSEYLPEPDKDVLIYIEQCKQVAVAHIQSGYYVNDEKYRGTLWFVTASENAGFDKEDVIYWMELPEAPKNENE